MIISANSEPNRPEFDLLLSAAITELNFNAKKSELAISVLKGNKLEPYVKDMLADLAVGTPFENSIELIGGQKFPDIIAKRYYGIEVKTTTQNHWKTTGNSVLESSRVDNIDRIFMLFAKLASPIEFRCRPYDECLSEVVVTHSPRYLIDMNLGIGQTIFDRIKIPYDTLRKKDNPIRPIVEYYKSKLKPGQDLWWIDQEIGNASNLVINLWKSLSPSQREEVKYKAMVYFPELFSNRTDKFERMSIWLVSREAIVCGNIRDHFTAGGKGDIIVGEKSFKNVPRILIKLLDNIDFIHETLVQTSSIELSEYWEIKTNETKKVIDWIDLVSENSRKIPDAKHLNVKEILTELILK